MTECFEVLAGLAALAGSGLAGRAGWSNGWLGWLGGRGGWVDKGLWTGYMAGLTGLAACLAWLAGHWKSTDL